MINLVPMTESDYRAYLAAVIPDYAADLMKSRHLPEQEALERARQSYSEALPQGLQTPGNFVSKLVNEADEVVGFLWYWQNDKRPGVAFIYDLEIYAPFRRRGYASQAMTALEAHARPKGVTRLELHVFGHNTAARELYKKMGYAEIDVQMAKEI